MTKLKIYGTKRADGEARSPFGPVNEQRIAKGVSLSVGALYPVEPTASLGIVAYPTTALQDEMKKRKEKFG